MLRRELQLQEKIKNEEITIPLVLYDGMAQSSHMYQLLLTIVVGTYIAPPNDGGVTVKKGEAVWLFLERARRMSG